MAKISVNKFAEYLVSSAGRRRRILIEQKTPNTFQVNYYQYSEGIIKDFILSKCTDLGILDDGLKKLLKKKPTNEFEFYRISANIDALESMYAFERDKNFRADKLTRGISNPPKLNFKNVDISVRPEIIIMNKSGTKPKNVGAIKLYFSKQTKLDKVLGEYISGLVFEFTKTFLGKHGKPAKNNCFVIDVFGKNIIKAPNAYKRLINDVEAACEEISIRWPTL